MQPNVCKQSRLQLSLRVYCRLENGLSFCCLGRRCYDATSFLEQPRSKASTLLKVAPALLMLHMRHERGCGLKLFATGRTLVIP